jgi:hypothetical protein
VKVSYSFGVAVLGLFLVIGCGKSSSKVAAPTGDQTKQTIGKAAEVAPAVLVDDQRPPAPELPTDASDDLL